MRSSHVVPNLFVAGFFLISLNMLSFLPLEAVQGARRVALVDLESKDLSADEKRRLLHLIREKIERYKIWQVIREAEILETLEEKSAIREESQRLEKSHEETHEKMKDLIMQAQGFYRESQFGEALGLLDSAFQILPQAVLKISEETLRELFELRGAIWSLMGEIPKAELNFAQWRSLRPGVSLTATYPPAVTLAFERSRAVAIPRKIWRFQSAQDNFHLTVLGIEKPAIREGDLFSVECPDLAGLGPVVIAKEGFKPQIYAVNELPAELVWTSLEVRKRSTKGLFAPVGDLTPHPELKWYVTHLQAFVVFLGSLQFKNDRYDLSGQWYEGASGNTSVVREVSDPQMNQGVERLLDLMSQDVSGDGSIIDARGGAPDRALAALTPSPFYKTWWFWTLTSIAAVGAGVGTYFLLNQEDKFKFQVVTP